MSSPRKEREPEKKAAPDSSTSNPSQTRSDRANSTQSDSVLATLADVDVELRASTSSLPPLTPLTLSSSPGLASLGNSNRSNALPILRSSSASIYDVLQYSPLMFGSALARSTSGAGLDAVPKRNSDEMNRAKSASGSNIKRSKPAVAIPEPSLAPSQTHLIRDQIGLMRTNDAPLYSKLCQRAQNFNSILTAEVNSAAFLRDFDNTEIAALRSYGIIDANGSIDSFALLMLGDVHAPFFQLRP